MPEGVQYPDIIDKVMQEKDGSVVLIMREDRPWDGSEVRTTELRKKINTYAVYARQGQLAKDFPDAAGKPVSFQLLCIQHRPDPKTMEFLDRTNAQLAQHSLQVRVRVVEVATPEMRQQERQRDGKPWWKIW
jgi:hypothetical protein